MLIERLRLKNILSFRDSTIKLGRLNVLIGPNAVGKSNLIEVIGLLQSAPNGLAQAIMRGGGIRQWLWLGAELPVTASIECDMKLRSGRQFGPLRYRLQILGDANHGYVISSEELTRRGARETELFLSRVDRDANVFNHGFDETGTEMHVHPTESVLSQFKNPADTTPITEWGNELTEIQIFREFRTGPKALMRQGIPTVTTKDALQEGGDNLAMVLQDFSFRELTGRINKYLGRFCERFDAVKVEIGDGLARTY